MLNNMCLRTVRGAQDTNLQVLICCTILLVIHIIVFHKHYSSSAIFPWDFFGGYHAMAFAWHLDGSWLNPPLWNAYGNYGFPWHLAMQNSAYYLPLQIIDWLGITYTLTVAASIQALHVLMGSLGVFFLATSNGNKPKSALIGAAVFHFSIGFYSNAQHVDIVRAYALLPWLFFVTRAGFLTSARRTAIATIVVTSFAVGAYPGVIIATVYLMPVYLIWQSFESGSYEGALRYIVALVCVLMLSGMLTMVKYGPVYQFSDVMGEVASTTRTLTSQHFLTLFFRFDLDVIPGGLSMRSYFLPVTAIVLLVFIQRWTSSVVCWILILLMSFALVSNGSPIRDIFANVPGFNVSRFHISDYRALIHISLAMVSATVISQLVEMKIGMPSLIVRIGTGISTLALLVVLALNSGYQISQIEDEMIITLLFIVSVGFFNQQTKKNYLVVATLLFTCLSGGAYLQKVPQVWKFEDYTEVLQGKVYDRDFRDLFVTHRAQSVPSRPSRFFARLKVAGNRGYYTQEYSQTGYDNGRRLKRIIELNKLMALPENKEFRVFMNGGSQFVLREQGPPSIQQLFVNETQLEPNEKVTIISFSQQGSVFEVKLDRPLLLIENELYFKGWKAKVCEQIDNCQHVLDSQPSNEVLRAWALPTGEYFIKTYFRPIGWKWFQLTSGSALLVLLVMLFWPFLKAGSALLTAKSQV